MRKAKAYFIDAGYTVRNGKTYVSLLLKGRKTVRRYYQFDPYFYVDAPLERLGHLFHAWSYVVYVLGNADAYCDFFNIRPFNSLKTGIIEQILGNESVYPFLRITRINDLPA